MELDDQIAALLISVRTLADQGLALLEQKRVTCPHAHRDDLEPFGRGVHWICQDCGYEYIGGDHAEEKQPA